MIESEYRLTATSDMAVKCVDQLLSHLLSAPVRVPSIMKGYAAISMMGFQIDSATTCIDGRILITIVKDEVATAVPDGFDRSFIKYKKGGDHSIREAVLQYLKY